MKILFLQHGNYSEAYQRFEDNGPETYRDQRRSVDFVAALARQHTITVVAICQDCHDTELAPGLTSVGAPRSLFDRDFIARIFDRTAPDLFICRTPFLQVLHQARTRRIPTLPVFADLFENDSLRKIVQNLRLRHALSGSNVACVSNHSLNASRSMAKALFYPTDRIVPWDWARISDIRSPKTAMADPARPTAFFAGKLARDKGVGDCLQAVRILRDRGIAMAMDFAGPGDLPFWSGEAEKLGLQQAVQFLGRIPNEDVSQRMQDADILLVPSRHSYAEGMPNTIYEALASASPLIISNHPAFENRLRPEQDCLVVPAADPSALADGMQRLCRDRDLYARLSAHAADALAQLYIGVEWSELIEHFIADPSNATGWVRERSFRHLGLR